MNSTTESTSNDNPKDNISALYNRVAPLYGQVGPGFFACAGQQLVSCMSIPEGAHVLDVGVGRGANLFPAAEKVGPHGQVIGIDLAEQMLQETSSEIARRNLPQATVLYMDAEQLTFAPDSFEAVLCGFAIFLFPHLERALSEFFRVLRPGGQLGITIAHNPDALAIWYGELITAYHDQYHFPLNAGGTTLDYHSEMPHYLSHAGFHNIQILHHQTEATYTSPQQWWDAKWTHGTRYSLEHMSPTVLEQFKTDIFAKLQEFQQPDGIHEQWNFQLILATKPAGNKDA